VARIFRDEVKIRDMRIAFARKGQGPELLLLHGGIVDNRMWNKQIEGLSDDFDVVAWDAPGHGGSSDPPEEDFSLYEYSKYLADFIEKIGLENPHILGLSFGSGLALAFYSYFPEIPKSLILASAYAGWAGSLPPEVVEERMKKSYEQSWLPPEKVFQAWLPTLFSDNVSEEVVEETKRLFYDFHPSGMRAVLNVFGRVDLRPVLPTIKVPVLLLYGEKDKRSPLKVGREMLEKIPGAQMAVIPGAGHACNLEAPEAFNREVRKFLREIT